MMDKFLTKELAIVDIGTGAGSSWIFRPPGGSGVQPMDVERASTFTYQNLHGMEWGTGDINYTTIPNIIQSYILDDMRAPLPLYGKGEEKARLLLARLQLARASSSRAPALIARLSDFLNKADRHFTPLISAAMGDLLPAQLRAEKQQIAPWESRIAAATLILRNHVAQNRDMTQPETAAYLWYQLLGEWDAPQKCTYRDGKWVGNTALIK
ncbi:Hypothetical protein NTJ_02744 [Nesidiocoris tenuis]|uniref:Uncharacterized protein n=1 Tax=Nesidiocoris tenuis TaxID=355587 RepID=A0ABN7ACB3_9HEMI|nr:Hypothetical protein NTJ_02744 [Nesidiocoris tenuis]